MKIIVAPMHPAQTHAHVLRVLTHRARGFPHTARFSPSCYLGYLAVGGKVTRRTPVGRTPPREASVTPCKLPRADSCRRKCV